MHAVTKMADLTKFCQTEWSFMDLTILDFDECWPFLLLHAFLDISDKVLKMANLTKFCETEWMFTDLTILANFSQTRKSEIRLSKVTIFDEFGQISHTESAWRMTILTNFGQIRHTEISLADDDLTKFSPISLLHAFQDISLSYRLARLVEVIFNYVKSLIHNCSWF